MDNDTRLLIFLEQDRFLASMLHLEEKHLCVVATWLDMEKNTPANILTSANFH